MKNFLLGIIMFSLYAFANILSAQTYDDVAILINTNSAESIEIGEYFQQKHGIADDKIIELAMPTNSVIDSASAQIILDSFNTVMDGFVGLNYLVTTKGCPQAIQSWTNEGLEYSFESILKTGSLYTNNAQDPVFEPGEFDSEEQGFLIVSKLAAKTLEGTFNLIDRGGQNSLILNDSLVLDMLIVEGSGNQTFENMFIDRMIDWRDDNEDLISVNVAIDLDNELYDSNGSNSGYFHLHSGPFEFDNISQVLLDNSYGLATILTPFGALEDFSDVDIKPEDFLETNNHAAIGAVDFGYFTQIVSMMDVYVNYYSLNKPYNLGESFAFINGMRKSQYVLYGDPKSTVSFVSSNEEIEDEFSFGLFPNPTLDQLNLEFAEVQYEAQVSLLTIDGKLHKTFAMSQTDRLQIDVSDLPSGEYVISIKKDKQGINKMFVKL